MNELTIEELNILSNALWNRIGILRAVDEPDRGEIVDPVFRLKEKVDTVIADRRRDKQETHMKLKTAKQYRAMVGQEIAEHQMSMKRLVATFLDGKVREAIEMACAELSKDERLKYGVNVSLPFEAYERKAEFVNACKAILEPLGFKAEESHDGGGIDATLYIEW